MNKCSDLIFQFMLIYRNQKKSALPCHLTLKTEKIPENGTLPSPKSPVIMKIGHLLAAFNITLVLMKTVLEVLFSPSTSMEATT